MRPWPKSGVRGGETRASSLLCRIEALRADKVTMVWLWVLCMQSMCTYICSTSIHTITMWCYEDVELASVGSQTSNVANQTKMKYICRTSKVISSDGKQCILGDCVCLYQRKPHFTILICQVSRYMELCVCDEWIHIDNQWLSLVGVWCWSWCRIVCAMGVDSDVGWTRFHGVVHGMELS